MGLQSLRRGMSLSREDRKSISENIENDIAFKNKILKDCDPRLLLRYMDVPPLCGKDVPKIAQEENDWLAMNELLEDVRRFDKIEELLKAMRSVNQGDLADRCRRLANRTLSQQ